MSSPMVRSLGHVVTMLATVAIILVAAVGGATAGGNNGTLKIHDLDSQAGFIDNEPKVCQFNVEAFNLDPGQNGYLVFTSQGGDLPSNSDVTVAPAFGLLGANASGYAESAQIFIPAGHWKATLYGKSTPTGYEDVKAKSKVFKKTCGGSPEDNPGGIG